MPTRIALFCSSCHFYHRCYCWHSFLLPLFAIAMCTYILCRWCYHFSRLQCVHIYYAGGVTTFRDCNVYIYIMQVVLPLFAIAMCTYILCRWCYHFSRLQCVHIYYAGGVTTFRDCNVYIYIMQVVLPLFAIAMCTYILCRWCYRVGMNLRSSVVTAVYHKALCISVAVLSRKTLGEITNLMSVDSGRLQVGRNKCL